MAINFKKVVQNELTKIPTRYDDIINSTIREKQNKYYNLNVIKPTGTFVLGDVFGKILNKIV